MQEDERDLLEVLIFDEIEETVGTWLRAIIQRLDATKGRLSESFSRRKSKRKSNGKIRDGIE
jgi:hypothetical protein